MANARGGNPNWKRNRKRRSKASFPGKDVPKCPYCGQNVRDILTAIALETDEAPTHFDCVIKKIGDDEGLQPKEKVVYLGNGGFGIVYFKNPSDPKQFTIRKHVQIEPEKKEITWRKAVSTRLSAR
jgi:hypothetical protein